MRNLFFILFSALCVSGVSSQELTLKYQWNPQMKEDGIVFKSVDQNPNTGEPYCTMSIHSLDLPIELQTAFEKGLIDLRDIAEKFSETLKFENQTLEALGEDKSGVEKANLKWTIEKIGKGNVIKYTFDQISVADTAINEVIAKVQLTLIPDHDKIWFCEIDNSNFEDESLVLEDYGTLSNWLAQRIK